MRVDERVVVAPSEYLLNTAVLTGMGVTMNLIELNRARKEKVALRFLPSPLHAGHIGSTTK